MERIRQTSRGKEECRARSKVSKGEGKWRTCGRGYVEMREDMKWKGRVDGKLGKGGGGLRDNVRREIGRGIEREGDGN